MQDLFQNPAVLWFIAGLALLLAELALPGLIILFFGVGAWITALTYLFFDIGFNAQLVVFMLSSVSTLAVLRRYLLKTNTITVPFLNTNELNQDFIGHTCTVSVPLAPGPSGGRVQFRGTNWKARAEVPVTVGKTVPIIGQDSIVLIVEPLT